MNPYINLAQEAIKAYLTNKTVIAVPENLPDDFYNRKAGVFVTICGKSTDGGKELRGCIGTYLPQKNNLAEEIIHNAIAAATQDYRFNPLSSNEINAVSIEVSILSEPEQINDINQLDTKKYGVIVSTADGKCGLLLPAIESVNSVNEQIAIACQKGGIDPNSDKLMLQRFTVEKHTD